MASWRPLGTSWAAVGRQMAAKTALEALLGGSWGGLGGSWASLGASLGLQGGPRKAPGGSEEGLGQTILAVLMRAQRQTLKMQPKKQLTSLMSMASRQMTTKQ